MNNGKAIGIIWATLVALVLGSYGYTYLIAQEGRDKADEIRQEQEVKFQRIEEKLEKLLELGVRNGSELDFIKRELFRKEQPKEGR